jgi:hypothetical protein
VQEALPAAMIYGIGRPHLHEVAAA